jgi:hypothetical protein
MSFDVLILNILLILSKKGSLKDVRGKVSLGNNAERENQT